MSTEEPAAETLDNATTSTVSHSTPSAASTATAAAAAATVSGASALPARLVGESLEQHCRIVEEELQILRESEIRLKQQHVESQRRERILIRRLALKEQELQDYANQITEFKTAQAPGPAALRTALLDPAVNILFQKLKVELQTTRARLEETQNELSAWKFTPDSNTGKRLMAKCRLLYQENEELGKMTSNGRLAKLEGDLALQKSFSEEVKKSQSELDDFLQELDEDVEGMQSTIFFLQQELKTSKDTINGLEREMSLLKNGGHQDDDGDENVDEDEDVRAERSNKRHNRHANNASNNGGTANAGDNGSNDEQLVVNGGGGGSVTGAAMTNCSVILRCGDKDVLKINSSERILRKGKLNSTNHKFNEPRTLRSSSRNISADDLRTTKVNNKANVNGNVGGGGGGGGNDNDDDDEDDDDDDEEDDDDDDDDEDDEDDNGGESGNTDVRRSNDVNNPGQKKFNNHKRTYDDSDSSECSSGNELTKVPGASAAAATAASAVAPSASSSSSSATATTNNINHKPLIKKVRRSSVLSLDLNEEDSQIDIDDDRSSVVVSSNGTKTGRNVD